MGQCKGLRQGNLFFDLRSTPEISRRGGAAASSIRLCESGAAEVGLEILGTTLPRPTGRYCPVGSRAPTGVSLQPEFRGPEAAGHSPEAPPSFTDKI